MQLDLVAITYTSFLMITLSNIRILPQSTWSEVEEEVVLTSLMIGTTPLLTTTSHLKRLEPESSAKNGRAVFFPSSRVYIDNRIHRWCIENLMKTISLSWESALTCPWDHQRTIGSMRACKSYRFRRNPYLLRGNLPLITLVFPTLIRYLSLK